MEKLESLFVFTFSGEGSALVSHARAEGINATLALIQDFEDVQTDEERSESKPEDPDERRRRLRIGSGMMPVFTAEEAMKVLRAMPAEERANSFVFFDMNYCFRFAEQLEELEIPGNYPTHDDRVFEADRDAGKKFVEKHYDHLQVAEHESFDSADDAREFLEDSEDCWALKGYNMNAPTVVPSTDDPEKAREQLLGALEERRESYEKDGFLLERKIPRALELTPQGVWFNGQLVYYSLDIELKKKGAGDTGMNVGCAANLVVPLSWGDPIIDIAFPRVVHELAAKHTGMFVWDASILIDPETEELFYGEFCSNRAGYDCIFTEIEMSGGVKPYFEAIASGRNPLVAPAGFATRVFNDHLDADHARQFQDGLFVDVAETMQSHVWSLDIRAETRKRTVTNGYIPDLLVVTGAGADPHAAISATYRNLLEGVSFEGAYYRPQHDIVAFDYPSAILNRYDYGRSHGLFGEDARRNAMPVPGWNKKNARQYKHIKERLLAKGSPAKEAKREATAPAKGRSVRGLVKHTRARD